MLLENYTPVFSEEITAGASEKTYTFRFQPPANAFGANPNGAYAANLVFLLRSAGTLYLSDVSVK